MYIERTALTFIFFFSSWMYSNCTMFHLYWKTWFIIHFLLLQTCQQHCQFLESFFSLFSFTLSWFAPGILSGLEVTNILRISNYCCYLWWWWYFFLYAASTLFRTYIRLSSKYSGPFLRFLTSFKYSNKCNISFYGKKRECFQIGNTGLSNRCQWESYISLNVY